MTIQANFPAIKPSLMLDFANTKQLDSRITYTRASTASYYDGVTTSKAEENLLTYSQEFDNAAWAKARATITANSTTAPDGTSTADSFIETTDTGGHTLTGTISATGPVVYSVYAKANTRTEIALYVGGVNKGKYFNLSTGAVGGDLIAAPDSASITSVGSGWYRCSITINSGTANSAQIYLAVSGAFSYTGDGTSGVYIWGAQFEQRSAVSAYTATTTQAITNYIPKLQSAASGVARFDNNPTTGESLGLLIEESRSNLLTYSSQFDNAAWTKSNSSVTADTIVAPDGTLSGEKLIENTSSAIHKVDQTQTVTNGASYTISVFAKAAERSWLVIYEDSGASNYAFFNLTTGALGTANAGTSTITPVGNGWYRCTLTHTQTIGTSERVRIGVSTGNTTFTYTGDGYSGIYIWGAQLEAGGFSTSYVPTVASQVTRAADAASMTGTNFSSWYNASEGTLYSEAKLLAIPGGSSYPGIVKISTDSGNKIGFWTIPAATSMYFSVSANSTSAADISVAQSPVSNFVKISGVYKVNDFAASVNASTVGTDTSGVIPVVNKMDIGTYDNSWNGTIKKIAYYPLRVTNAQLQSLTS